MIENGGNINSVSVTHSDSCSDSENDEVSTIQEFSDNYGSQDINLPGLDTSNLATTVVKMKNSSHVEITPVTQVTIHQYFRNSENPQSDDSIPTISKYFTKSNGTSKAQFGEETEPRVPMNTSKEKLYHKIMSNTSWRLGFILILSIAVIAVVVIVSCVILLGKNDEYRPPNPSDLEETDYDLGNDLHILTRGRWGGRDILDGYQNRTLVHPIKLVIIGHTASPQCLTVQSCAQRLQSIQSYHVSDLGYVDIGYNFLVGGDGNLYQALGWDIRNYLRNNSIQIQFIGSYAFDQVLEKQKMGAKALLEYGVKLGKLDEDYLLVAHSQVANTESPGKNLLAEIKLWPHYYNGTLTT